MTVDCLNAKKNKHHFIGLRYKFWVNKAVTERRHDSACCIFTSYFTPPTFLRDSTVMLVPKHQDGSIMICAINSYLSQDLHYNF